MKKASLIGFAVFFMMVGQVFGTWEWPPTGGTVIVPQNPTSHDVVYITLWGEWGDSCTPNASAISVVGNDIYFDVIQDYPPGIGCLTVLTPWGLTESVGPLSTGTYAVYASLNWGSYTPVADFIVTASIYYVDTVNGDDNNGGLSPQTAFATIQAGVDAAIDGDTVIVVDGTYTGDGNRNLDFLGKSITLRSENGPESCIIDCWLEGRGFYFHNGEDASSIVDGFTIVWGTDYCPQGPCPISTYGGGIYCGNASPTIRNCIIGYSYASFGGGIYGSATIINCIIYNNSGVEGAGIWCSANTKILNCTIVGNSGERSGGVAGSSGLVINSILWGNVPNQVGGNPTVKYSDVQGGWPGEGNIDADPLFADPTNGDYHLKSQAGRWEPVSESWVNDEVTSPCIDAGNPGCPVGDEPAPNGNRINMGAYGGTAEASKSPANWALLADLTNDGIVDFVDLAVFFGYWPDSGQCIPADLNRSGSVDSLDYSILANQWPDAIVAEPQIQYEIAPCGLGAASFFAAEESLETRFTATVEGWYIHFEDMMRANCCATELWLDMNVEDDLITIFEHESGGYCLCICNYPVTATFGPFEEGTYLLEVYEDRGGFIGSTIVTIGPAE